MKEIEPTQQNYTVLLQRQGHNKTIKFLIAPDGRIISLKGLWHYHWALKHANEEQVNLGGETTENPVRLCMLSYGWWRVNYDCRSAALTIEGDCARINQTVEEAAFSLVKTNPRMINRVNLAVLNGDSVKHRTSIKNRFESDEPSFPFREITRFFNSCCKQRVK